MPTQGAVNKEQGATARESINTGSGVKLDIERS
jgi:hypothetical protein